MHLLWLQARERRLVGWLTRRGHGWRVARDLIQTLSDEDDEAAAAAAEEEEEE